MYEPNYPFTLLGYVIAGFIFYELKSRVILSSLNILYCLSGDAPSGALCVWPFLLLELYGMLGPTLLLFILVDIDEAFLCPYGF
jgi:hypothetical protein